MDKSTDVIERHSYVAKGRPLRTHAELRLDGTVSNVIAERIDTHGVSLIVERSIKTQTHCEVHINLVVDSAKRRLSAEGIIVSSYCIGMDGFRIYVRFTNMAADSAVMLERLLGPH